MPQDSTSFLDQLPLEGIAFLAAAAATRIFFPPFTAPLLGIGLSFSLTRLALKFLDCYDGKGVVELTKEACKWNRKYPKLQLISFIFSLAIAFISKTVAFLTGALVGSFGALILDVENYKLLQQVDRKIRTQGH